jgi:hypothetical protein
LNKDLLQKPKRLDVLRFSLTDTLKLSDSFLNSNVPEEIQDFGFFKAPIYSPIVSKAKLFFKHDKQDRSNEEFDISFSSQGSDKKQSQKPRKI